MIRERSERGKIEKNKRFGHKKIIGPRPLGGGRAPGAPPPLDPLVQYADDWQSNFNSLTFSLKSFIFFKYNVYLINICIYFVFTALFPFSCACDHEIV